MDRPQFLPCPVCSSMVIDYTRTAPNGWEGRFRSDNERTSWLEDAARHIKAA